jgi:hypothetical protein
LTAPVPRLRTVTKSDITAIFSYEWTFSMRRFRHHHALAATWSVFIFTTLLLINATQPSCSGEVRDAMPEPAQNQDGAGAVVPAHHPVSIGTNLHGVADWHSGWVFVDVFKHRRAWIPQTTDPNGPWDTGESILLTDGGWVAELKPNQVATTLMCWDLDGHYPAGTYVCLYDGTGQIEFAAAARATRSDPGRIEVDVDPLRGGIMLKIVATDPADPIRNIRLIMPGFEHTYEAQIFHPAFLDSLAPFSTIRFMDWQATNDSTLAHWEDRTLPDDSTQSTGRGVALEYMIDLCNQLHKDAWFCMPHLADDAYVRNFARMVRDELDPSLHVYIEHSNEVWNLQFGQAQYAQKIGGTIRLAVDPYDAHLLYHALRSREIFAIWYEVFGDAAPQRLVRVLGAQAANPYTTQLPLGWEDTAQEVDAVAIAPYFGGVLGRSGVAEEVVEMSVDEILDECEELILTLEQRINQHRALTDQYGLELICYEAGQHMVGVGIWVNDDRLTDRFVRANRHARMRQLYTDYLRMWERTGGGLIMMFTHMGKQSKWGSWGMKVWQDEPLERSPKYMGVLDYMTQRGDEGRSN